MQSLITLLVFAILVIIMGILNICGNISSLHHYHRHRVAPENVKPFGRLVGIGTVIIGTAMGFYAVLSYISERLALPILKITSSIILVISIIAGLLLCFYAMLKYNKGIF